MLISEWKQYNYWNEKEGYITVKLGHQNLIFLFNFAITVYIQYFFYLFQVYSTVS